LKLSHFKHVLLYIHTYLLSKRSGLGGLNCLKKITVSDKIRLINEHASIEIQRRFGTQVRGPLNFIRALLAVTNLVLRGVAPGLLAETIHDGIEIIIRKIKQVVNVSKNLDVTV